MSRARGSQGERTRTRVVRAAAKLFARGGAEAVTIAAVAEASKTSVGSLYHHFGDKQGILAAVFADQLQGYREQLAAALRAPTGEGLLTALVTTHLRWVEDQPDEARAIEALRAGAVSEAAAGGVGAGELLRADTRAFLAPFRARYEAEVEAGGFRRLPWPVVPLLVLAPTHALARQWLDGRELGAPLSSFAPALASAAYAALRAEPE